MPDPQPVLQHNLDQIEEKIRTACAVSGRSRDEVQLIPVTKYAQLEWVKALVNLGYHHLGESRPQQLLQRSEMFPANIKWHMIGQLQRNKVRKLIPATSLIHSVDSMKLLTAIERITQEENLEREEQLKPEVLLQVNVSGEESKQGFTPEELRVNWEAVQSLQATKVVGLMTMAPKVEEIEQSRPCFASLRELREELNQASSNLKLKHLSMGMSRDFRIAVEEGATLIRIGSLLFSGLKESEPE